MKINFRQAFIFSLTVHLLLIPGIGWLAGSWMKNEPAGQIIEIELAAGGPGPIMTGGAAGQSTTRDNASTITSDEAVEPEPLTPETIDPIEPIDTAAAEPVTSTVSKIAKHLSPVVQGANHAGGSGGTQTGGGVAGGEGAGLGTGTGTAQKQSIVLPPRVLKRIEPQYPAAARRANQEGVVDLRIEILANGLPGSISIVSSSGYQDLDEAAEAAVRKWRFVPARDSQSGSPVVSMTTLSIAFRLR